jgi:TonB family protein
LKNNEDTEVCAWYFRDIWGMKNTLTLLVCFLAGTAFSQATAEPELLEIKENPSANYYRTYHVRKDAPDTLYGAFEEVYNNVVITQGEYWNNQPHGKWVFTGMNKKPQMVLHFERGIRNGEFLRYFPTGDTAIYCSYSAGRLNGLKKEFYDNGRPLFYGSYENGVRNGAYKAFYETGTLADEGAYRAGKPEGTYKSYYPSGTLRLEMEFKNGVEWTLVNHLKKDGKKNPMAGTLSNGNGTITIFNNDEAIIYTLTVQDGHYEGPAKYYGYDGKVRKEINYVNGISNESERVEPDPWEDEPQAATSRQMRVFPDSKAAYMNFEMPVFREEMPEFIDGNFSAYLQNNVKYPAQERKDRIQGTVYVSFVVNKFGFVEDARVTKSVSPALDAEALRVILSMPRWTPAFRNSEPARMPITQPIKFVL